MELHIRLLRGKMLSALQKKQYLSNKYDDMLKAATKEASGLSGVPVRQVQEDLVRDRGFKHRKQAQMACRRILHSTSPSSSRMLEKTSSPKIREDRDVACGVPLCNNNEIKSWAASQAAARL